MEKTFKEKVKIIIDNSDFRVVSGNFHGRICCSLNVEECLKTRCVECELEGLDKNFYDLMTKYVNKKHSQR